MFFRRGRPGTGKTNGRGVIRARTSRAGPLRASIWSQWSTSNIGETEKNLERIFTAAQTATPSSFLTKQTRYSKKIESAKSHDRLLQYQKSLNFAATDEEEYQGISNYRRRILPPEFLARRLRAGGYRPDRGVPFS